MRIGKLELIRYGKFSDEAVAFPRSSHDFHFLVGPNEAGKSTIKTAITELLFGMPHSSPLDFIHPQSELRLGAVIEHSDQSLAFHRSKARKASLSAPTGEPLAGEALVPFLGEADKAFFEQMFCLDHTSLIKGGQSILDASSDVGQVLFQSAAGISSLGPVRERLAQEADRLWSKRKSGERAYYVGQKQLDDASAELRAAVVRTSAWRAAQETVDDALEGKQSAERQHGELELKRSRLERIRRVTHHLAVWREKTAELRTLGEVIDLPHDADATLQGALRKLAAADSALEVHLRRAGELQGTLDNKDIDQTALAFQSEIEALESTRHRCGDHEADIARLEQQVSLLVRQVADACVQLEWPRDELVARNSVPSALALHTVESLMRDRGKLEQSVVNAQQALEKKLAEIADLGRKLESLPAGEVPDDVQAALRSGQRYRENDLAQRRLTDAAADAQRTLDASLAALGKWSRPLPALKSMTLPSTERVASLRAERDDLVSRLMRARDRLDEAREGERLAVAEHDSFEQAHQIVTGEVVVQARGVRDAAWAAIRDGAVSVADGAPQFEAAMTVADDLSDRQVGSVTEATELSNLKQRVLETKQTALRHGQRVAEAEEALARFDAAWASVVSEQQLAGMALDDIASWITRRESALQASAALEKSTGELERERAEVESCRARLAGCLVQAGLSGPLPAELEDLCTMAERYVSECRQAATTQRLLAGQIEAAQADVASLRREADAHVDAHGHWKDQWAAAMTKAGLSAVADSDAATGAALGIARTVREQLDEIAAIRNAQIDPMRVALADFSADASRLAVKFDVPMPEADAKAISIELSRRLSSARAVQAESQRLTNELVDVSERVRLARAEVDEATAQLRPLYALAAVDKPDLLRPLIARSDRKRELATAIGQAHRSLVNDGDGLGIEELAGEVDATDLQTVQADLLSVGVALTDSVNARAEMATRVAEARQQLAAISGGANAAIAEAKRQEALAAMAEAAERFIKVETASTLLRWAVDRYRERRQGPMLARASAIFSELTLGAFERLSVDYDSQPLALAAVRAGGKRVEISGMSEGTRDQLYLALRLAALELHCERGSALPFVADDLFINFDDRRAKAGLRVLAGLAARMQVIFLSHHDHLVEIVNEVFGASANVRYLG
ncbi:AAA family ATPase [Paraburkholderia sp. CNPSo 3157]|uniref:AAA family ATPase n=1 Tax=Paraburkholderia franconis TaxID=2654983 RepID=A0A7X1NK67_9BURK|nr:YhaN family protein [Paraburkholderia franconis]MPW22981.1 AAA family ATPase [Paraburkholderia franconis]